MITIEEQERDYKIHCAAVDAANDELSHLDELMFEVNSKVNYYNGFIRGFKKGAAWADKHPESPWIKLREWKPYIMSCVLVYHDEEVFTAYFKEFDGVSYWYVNDGLIEVSENDYWMLIPKLEEE